MLNSKLAQNIYFNAGILILAVAIVLQARLNYPIQYLKFLKCVGSVHFLVDIGSSNFAFSNCSEIVRSTFVPGPPCKAMLNYGHSNCNLGQKSRSFSDIPSCNFLHPGGSVFTETCNLGNLMAICAVSVGYQNIEKNVDQQ